MTGAALRRPSEEARGLTSGARHSPLCWALFFSGPPFRLVSVRAMKAPPSEPSLSPERLRELTAELHEHAPRWASRLSQARSDRELLDVVKELCNLSHSVGNPSDEPPDSSWLREKIRAFIQSNLHQGVTLKVLATFLGYSEKYCSDLFQALMGVSFSIYLRRARVESACRLLTSSPRSLAEIAACLGFSDQFAFSHFFKRATGHAPLHYREQRSPYGHRRAPRRQVRPT